MFSYPLQLFHDLSIVPLIILRIVMELRLLQRPICVARCEFPSPHSLPQMFETLRHLPVDDGSTPPAHFGVSIILKKTQEEERGRGEMCFAKCTYAFIRYSSGIGSTRSGLSPDVHQFSKASSISRYCILYECSKFVVMGTSLPVHSK